MSATPTTAPRYRYTICSQCGQDMGPGDEGFSHCADHAGKRPAFPSVLDAIPADSQGKGATEAAAWKQLISLGSGAPLLPCHEAAAIEQDRSIARAKDSGVYDRVRDNAALRDQIQYSGSAL